MEGLNFLDQEVKGSLRQGRNWDQPGSGAVEQSSAPVAAKEGSDDPVAAVGKSNISVEGAGGMRLTKSIGELETSQGLNER